jgi:hypothetical protein
MATLSDDVLLDQLKVAKVSVSDAEVEIARLFEELKGVARAEKTLSRPVEAALAKLTAAKTALAEIERVLADDDG